MKDKVKEYICVPYSTVIVPDVTTDNQPCYIASHPELEGCMSHGNTIQEALNNLQEVTELYITVLLDKGLDVPLPLGWNINWNVITSPNEYEVAPYIATIFQPFLSLSPTSEAAEICQA